MNILFTPWRYDYLKQPRPVDCIFCNALAPDQPAADTLLLHAGRHNMVLMNRFPYTNGHLMIAPIEHLGSPLSAADEVLADLMTLTRDAQRILAGAYQPDGFNIGMNVGRAAGAGIESHFHMHLVPRWSGDTNFMTVNAETRMVPEPLDATHLRLSSLFTGLGPKREAAPPAPTVRPVATERQ